MSKKKKNLKDFQHGLWKVSPNILLKIIFIILLFPKNVFASANINHNQDFGILKSSIKIWFNYSFCFS